LSGKAHANTLWVILGGVLVSFIAVALLTPLLGRPVVSLLGRLFSWSVPGQLGRRNSARNPRRTAITAASMMISVALVTAVSMLFSSASTSIGRSVDQQLHADLVIAGSQSGPVAPPVDPAVLDRVRALSDVDTVAADASDIATVDGKQAFVVAFDDLGTAARTLSLKPKDGRLSSLGTG